MNVVALLDSMWGWRGYSATGDEVRWFRINPENFSGKRLYRLCCGHNLVVTNSCRACQATANHHGTPDPEWVKENLRFLESRGMDLLLVCGRVAQDTFGRSGGTSARIPVLFIDHPAARRWTNASLDATRELISKALSGVTAQ
jgi:hypothetical protein